MHKCKKYKHLLRSKEKIPYNPTIKKNHFGGLHSSIFFNALKKYMIEMRLHKSM